MSSGARRLAVLGSPISHSKSPAIHSAAYRVLGLDWDYSAIEVKSGALAEFFALQGPQWKGLSLTMPLKREVLPLLHKRDHITKLVGAANTVLFDRGKLIGFNTDVYGVRRMLREAIPQQLNHVHIFGGGATACSIAVALAQCGVRKLTIGARSTAGSTELLQVARKVELDVTVDKIQTDPGPADLVISTLPGTAVLDETLPARLISTVPLIDIAYAPWPTAVSQQWLTGGGSALNGGLGMLVYQALAQIRIFVGGDPTHELPSEPEVLSAMMAAAFDAT